MTAAPLRQNSLRQDTTILAYLGDAVFELHVRQHVLDQGVCKAENLHKAAVKYVRAEAQAQALKLLLPDLTEEELTLVKRARNKKITSKPRNADPIAYKWATALEALIGYLHLSQQSERLSEIIARVIQTTEAIPAEAIPVSEDALEDPAGELENE